MAENGNGSTSTLADFIWKNAIPTTGTTLQVEYGPHIPTLVEIAESGGLD